MKAGSGWNLPSFFISLLLLLSDVSLSAKETPVIVFQEFESSCIDLGRYEAKARELTVRFAGRKPERFYRYSGIPSAVWKELLTLNQTGGVGEYFNETVVKHPEKYPFTEIAIHSFKVIPKKKKAGDSK